MPQYGALSVFQRVTADSINALIPDSYVKVGATVRASNATLADDPELIVPFPANATVLVKFHVKYATTTAAGFQTSWNVTGTVTSANRDALGLAGAAALDATPSGTTFATRSGVHGYATSLAYGSRNDVTLQVWLEESAIITTTTTGTVAFRWAQSTLTAVNTTVFAGSYGQVTRLA